jgi:hypothetical protein
METENNKTSVTKAIFIFAFPNESERNNKVVGNISLDFTNSHDIILETNLCHRMGGLGWFVSTSGWEWLPWLKTRCKVKSKYDFATKIFSVLAAFSRYTPSNKRRIIRLWIKWTLIWLLIVNLKTWRPQIPSSLSITLLISSKVCCYERDAEAPTAVIWNVPFIILCYLKQKSIAFINVPRVSRCSSFLSSPTELTLFHSLIIIS